MMVVVLLWSEMEKILGKFFVAVGGAAEKSFGELVDRERNPLSCDIQMESKSHGVRIVSPKVIDD